jgi:nitrogen fixation NifU-like protein
MACCSAITEIAKNKSIDEAKRIRREDVIASVGGLPEASGHAAYLAVDALNAILKALATKSRL